mmetsp:Transcript_37626/g.59502  ORF Transcript_37626/g.59502 Transcript_37626/m.59502 type:complete len:103 (-) Transcript_37626:339-647(-)
MRRTKLINVNHIVYEYTTNLPCESLLVRLSSTTCDKFQNCVQDPLRAQGLPQHSCSNSSIAVNITSTVSPLQQFEPVHVFEWFASERQLEKQLTIPLLQPLR